ncbi:MAG: hypothetical protein KAS32_13930 [Candidatus Peribacteraceae bacterium]|nr:hypothetical protein [Candidatus Peribacteraceae bacterium]
MLSVQLTGVQKAMNDLKLDKNDVRQAMTESGLKMEADSKQICTDMGAVLTGRLRASVSTALDGDSPRGGDFVEPPHKDPSAIAVLRIGSSVEYAVYVLLGTKRMLGRDFITPAVHMNLGDIEAGILSKMKQ